MIEINTWIKAFRLRTLPLAFSSILMASFLAYYSGHFQVLILVLSLVTTLFLQVLSNLANDYGDAVSGVDGPDRGGPKRAVQSGAITRGQMKIAIILCAFLAFISGFILIIYVFRDHWLNLLVFLTLGIGAIAAAIKYTMGSNPYGYSGFGDLFVFIFFGLVGVFGGYYLFNRDLEIIFLLPAISCGLLSVGVLNVNNIRDISSDRKAGKRSIPVIIGKEKAIIYHGFLIVGSFLSSIIFVSILMPSFFGYAFLGLIPFFFYHFKAIKVKEGSSLDVELKKLAFATLFFVLLLGFGINY
jgi:1,4-dihydroxy-2-naphthoate octaprenyltransferase